MSIWDRPAPASVASLIYAPTNWKDFGLVDSGDGLKLERWKSLLLVRPDPQAIWARSAPELWKHVDATYNRHKKIAGEDGWQTRPGTPKQWNINYGSMVFKLKLTSFKHTGIFPEQAVQWDWMSSLVGGGFVHESPSVLNLFGYTGAASLACAKAGAHVTHVDASKGTVRWCKENTSLSGLRPDSLRTIVDDVFKFVRRERRRSRLYDGIVMDPPSFGRGTTGETWKLEKHLWSLLLECKALLSRRPLFVLVNVYKTGLSARILHNMLVQLTAGQGGRVESGEVGLLHEANKKLILPGGIFARWSRGFKSSPAQ